MLLEEVRGSKDIRNLSYTFLVNQGDSDCLHMSGHLISDLGVNIGPVVSRFITSLQLLPRRTLDSENEHTHTVSYTTAAEQMPESLLG